MEKVDEHVMIIQEGDEKVIVNVRKRRGLFGVCSWDDSSIRLDGCKCRLESEAKGSTEKRSEDREKCEPACWRALEANRGRCREGGNRTRCNHVSGSGKCST